MLFITPKHNMPIVVFVSPPPPPPPPHCFKETGFMILCVCARAHVNVKDVFGQIFESESANCLRILTLVDPVFVAQPLYWFGSTYYLLVFPFCFLFCLFVANNQKKQLQPDSDL